MKSSKQMTNDENLGSSWWQAPVVSHENSKCSSDQTYQCHICGKCCKTSKSLREAFIWINQGSTFGVEAQQEGLFSCIFLCSKFPIFCLFIMKASRRQHKYQVHSDNHRHQCKTCGSMFRTSSILKNHLLTHVEKSFCCPKCKKDSIMSIIKQSFSMEHFDWDTL